MLEEDRQNICVQSWNGPFKKQCGYFINCGFWMIDLSKSKKSLRREERLFLVFQLPQNTEGGNKVVLSKVDQVKSAGTRNDWFNQRHRSSSCTSYPEHFYSLLQRAVPCYCSTWTHPVRTRVKLIRNVFALSFDSPIWDVSAEREKHLVSD